MAHRHCLTCVNANCLMPECETICAMTECEMKCGAKFHYCKRVDHRRICQNELVPCINESNGCPAMIPRWMTGKHLENCPACVVACSKCCGDKGGKPFKSGEEHRLVENGDVISETSSDAGVAMNSDGNVVTYPPFFRRDELKNHILNTHNFLMSNVTGPIVESCPLANLGCDFRFSRCRLVTPDYHRAYAPLLNVIGFRNKSKYRFEPDQGISQYPSVTLTKLPVDVLLYIFDKLDNFSLICMSLTCKTFRDLSSHRLKQSGIVFRRWRKSSDGSAKWISSMVMNLCQL